LLSGTAPADPLVDPVNGTLVFGITLNKSSLADGRWHLLQFEFVV